MLHDQRKEHIYKTLCLINLGVNEMRWNRVQGLTLSGAAWVPNNGGPLRRVRSVKHEHGPLDRYGLVKTRE